MENKEDIREALNAWFDGQDKWATKKELAVELGVSHSTVRKYFSEGRIPRKAENRIKLHQLTGLQCFESDAAKDSLKDKASEIEPVAHPDKPNRPTTPMIVASLDSVLRNITKDVSERVEMRSFLRSLGRAWKDGDIETVNWIVRGDMVASLLRCYPEAETVIADIKSSLQQQAPGVNEFGLMLEHYCYEKGVKLDGRPPRFVVEHLIHVEFLRETNIVRAGMMHLQNPEWAEVEQMLEGELKRVWDRDFSFLEFYDDLMLCCENIAKSQPNGTGWFRLADIYREIQNLDSEGSLRRRSMAYHEDAFSADLSKFLWTQTNGNNPDPQLEFGSNRDPRLSFIVILPDDTTASYSFIRPRKT